jgi:plasmid stabilization system protein ParE
VRLRWTLDAADDLEGIHKYLSAVRPELTQRTILHIYNELKTLRTYPHMGRVALRYDVRELFLWPLPYVCTYRVEDTAVTILRIHHTAQDRSNLQ